MGVWGRAFRILVCLNVKLQGQLWVTRCSLIQRWAGCVGSPACDKACFVKLFLEWLCRFTFPPAVLPPILTAFLLAAFLLGRGASHYAFICIFLMAGGPQHLFTGLCAILASSLVKYLFNSWAHLCVSWAVCLIIEL